MKENKMWDFEVSATIIASETHKWSFTQSFLDGPLNEQMVQLIKGCEIANRITRVKGHSITYGKREQRVTEL